jgi:type II secretory pathway component PulF
MATCAIHQFFLRVACLSSDVRKRCDCWLERLPFLRQILRKLL